MNLIDFDDLKSKLKFGIEDYDSLSKVLVYEGLDMIKELLVQNIPLKKICEKLKAAGYNITYRSFLYHFCELVPPAERKKLYDLGKERERHKHLYRRESNSKPLISKRSILSDDISVDAVDIEDVVPQSPSSRNTSISDEEQRLINAAKRDADFEKEKALRKFSPEDQAFYDKQLTYQDKEFVSLVIRNKGDIEKIKEVWIKKNPRDFEMDHRKRNIFMAYESRFKSFIETKSLKVAENSTITDS